MASNIPRLSVTALTERLQITGFSDQALWIEWLRNDMDLLSNVAHREALLLVILTSSCGPMNSADRKSR